MTARTDRFEFLMGCLLEGAFSNPNIFNLEALRRGSGVLAKQVVDACAAVAEEALLVSDQRFDKPNGMPPNSIQSIGKILAKGGGA